MILALVLLCTFINLFLSVLALGRMCKEQTFEDRYCMLAAIVVVHWFPLVVIWFLYLTPPAPVKIVNML